MNADEAKAVALAALGRLDVETLADAGRCNTAIADAILSDPRYDADRDHIACWVDVRDGRRGVEVCGFATREAAQQWLSERVLGTAYGHAPACVDRDGRRITYAEFARLMEDPTYYRVALDHLYGFRVSTVWLGIDHSFGEGGPLVFETMVFDDTQARRTEDLDLQHRWSTEAEARSGHLHVLGVVRDLAESSMRPPA